MQYVVRGIGGVAGGLCMTRVCLSFLRPSRGPATNPLTRVQNSAGHMVCEKARSPDEVSCITGFLQTFTPFEVMVTS